jgi:hypothetical protein
MYANKSLKICKFICIIEAINGGGIKYKYSINGKQLSSLEDDVSRYLRNVGTSNNDTKQRYEVKHNLINNRRKT